VIAYHSREIGNILLLLLSCYYHMDYIWIIIGDRAGLYLELDMDLVGQSERDLVAFVPPVSIKDRSLHWIPGQVTDLFSRAYTSGWGLGRLVTLLSWAPALSGPTDWRRE
jgi:hypothetical protein